MFRDVGSCKVSDGCRTWDFESQKVWGPGGGGTLLETSRMAHCEIEKDRPLRSYTWRFMGSYRYGYKSPNMFAVHITALKTTHEPPSSREACR